MQEIGQEYSSEKGDYNVGIHFLYGDNVIVNPR